MAKKKRQRISYGICSAEDFECEGADNVQCCLWLALPVVIDSESMALPTTKTVRSCAPLFTPRWASTNFLAGIREDEME
jgi:hypothetical protein